MEPFTGHNLPNGKYYEGSLSEDEMGSAFSYLFSSKSVNNTSYKFGFFKAILDNLYNVDDKLELNFDQLFSKFAEIYWNLILKYGILQKNPGVMKRQSAIETVLFQARLRKYAF